MIFLMKISPGDRVRQFQAPGEVKVYDKEDQHMALVPVSGPAPQLLFFDILPLFSAKSS